LERALDDKSDSYKLKEQRDLLIDLRGKVSMFERELKLVSEQSQAEIAGLNA